MPGVSSKRSFPEIFAAMFVSLILLYGCAPKGVIPPEAATVEHRPWGTYLADETRSNHSTDRFTAPAQLSWYVYLPSYDYLSPGNRVETSSTVISRGTLYTATSQGILYAFDAGTAKPLWTYDAGYSIESTPTVEGEHICFGSSDGAFRCIGSRDGSPLWKFQARSSVLSSPVIKNETVYFHASDDRVYALDLKTGEKKWVFTRGTYQTVAPRVTGSSALYNGSLYTLFSDGHLVCIDASTGREIWSTKAVAHFDSPVRTRRTPLVRDGMVYMLDADNSVAAFDAVTGDLKNSYNVIKAYDFVMPDARTIVLAGAEMLVSVDTVTGSINWKKELSRRPLAAVFASGDHVIAVSNFIHNTLGLESLSKARVYVEAFRLNNGETAWGTELDGSASAGASSAGNNIALITDDGFLNVLGAEGCIFCRKMLPDND